MNDAFHAIATLLSRLALILWRRSHRVLRLTGQNKKSPQGMRAFYRATIFYEGRFMLQEVG
jgi:hypothetical protein